MRFTHVTILVLLACTASAQSWRIPIRLGPGVNTGYHEINPVLSPDGKTLYFVRANHPDNTFGRSDSEDIWYSVLQEDSSWSEARRIPELNIGRYNAVLSVSGDGNTLLLNGIYNKRGNIWKKRGLSLVHRDGDVWGTPEQLKMKKYSRKNRGLQSSAAMSADGDYIVLSFSTTFNGQRSNLYYSRKKKNNRWSRPVKLAGVNSGARDEAPFLSPDGTTLYFTSNRKTRKNFDVYQATIREEGKLRKWSKPIPLSDTVNTTGWESYFKTNHTGDWAIYSSTTGSPGNADLFIVRIAF